jgi:hypothetical protein
VRPSPGPLIVDGNRLAVEINLVRRGRHIAVGDFFTVDGDTITRLVILFGAELPDAPRARNTTHPPDRVDSHVRSARRVCRSVARFEAAGRGEAMATESYDKGEGWLFFAFVLLVIVGFFNVVLGLTMIAGDSIYVTARDAGTVVIGNVNGWGWVILILGIFEVLAGFGVLARSQLSRWFAILMATLAALGHLPVIFGPHPIYSFLVVLLSVLVIYGLAQYGGRDRVAV